MSVLCNLCGQATEARTAGSRAGSRGTLRGGPRRRHCPFLLKRRFCWLRIVPYAENMCCRDRRKLCGILGLGTAADHHSAITLQISEQYVEQSWDAAVLLLPAAWHGIASTKQLRCWHELTHCRVVGLLSHCSSCWVLSRRMFGFAEYSVHCLPFSAARRSLVYPQLPIPCMHFVGFSSHRQLVK